METETELIIASSQLNAGISTWDLRTGTRLLQYESCASYPRGLISVAGRFLASSQVQSWGACPGSIRYWSWNKPQVEVRSIRVYNETIAPLVSNSQGTYIVGGGDYGNMHFWEVATGKLLKKFLAHSKAVTCLVFNDDQSMLISGGKDGCVSVWVLARIFDDLRSGETSPLLYTIKAHRRSVNDIKISYDGCNAIIVSASDDCTCKVWSLASGELFGVISLPYEIDSIALVPGKRVLYVGDKCGWIFTVGLYVPEDLDSGNALYRIDHFLQRGAVTCLALSADGFLLVSGSDDGNIRVWDTRTRKIVRVLRHTRSLVSNVLIVTLPIPWRIAFRLAYSLVVGFLLTSPLKAPILGACDSRHLIEAKHPCDTSFIPHDGPGSDASFCINFPLVS